MMHPDCSACLRNGLDCDPYAAEFQDDLCPNFEPFQEDEGGRLDALHDEVASGEYRRNQDFVDQLILDCYGDPEP